MKIKRVLIIGYGSIGQGLTSLLLKHFDLKPQNVHVVTADLRGYEIAQAYGINFDVNPITPKNFNLVMHSFKDEVDVVINVSVDVSSYELAKWCQQNGVLYLDTCVEPWLGGYRYRTLNETTNYFLREQILSLPGRGRPTALVAHGANPGLVSHFVKQGLLELAKVRGVTPTGDFAELAEQLGVKIIQIAERDTQDDGQPLTAGEFKNTWSVDGFISEAFDQCAELGWGTHEQTLPSNAHTHNTGCKAAIYLDDPGAQVRVKSWVPSLGEQDAMLITHHESIAIANFLTRGGDHPTYRPTVYYAYHPSEQTMKSVERVLTGEQVERKTIMKPTSGYDELGVLFVYSGGAYWYGSTLTHDEAAKLAPNNSATSLQVTATMIGALKWMEQNPNCGVVEAEDVDFQSVLAISSPYLGHVRGVQTEWQPRNDCALQFTDFLQ